MVDRKREIFRDGGYASKILFPVEQNRCNRYWYQLLTVKRARRSQARVKLVGSNNEYISLNVTVGMNTCWEISFQLLEATTRDKRLYIFRAALQSSHGFLEHLYLLNDVSFFFLFSFFTKIHERLVTINHFSFSRIIRRDTSFDVNFQKRCLQDFLINIRIFEKKKSIHIFNFSIKYQ